MEAPIKVLILSEDIFLPENKNGISKTLYNVLKSNKEIEATLFCPTFNNKIPDGFSHVTFQSYSRTGEKSFSLLSKIRSFLSLSPFIRSNSKLIQEVALIIKKYESGFDRILIVSLSLAPVLDFLPEGVRDKVAILAIDSYSHWFSFKVKNETNIFKKFIWWIEMKKGEAYERKYYDLCSLALFVSKVDAKYAEGLGPTRAKKVGMRYGIDLEKINQGMDQFKDVTKEKETLLFTGNLGYGPNQDAIRFLLYSLLPKLWKIRPNVKIYFVGGGAPEYLKNFNDERVVVTGFVDSLVPYMKKTALFISPLFFGVGTKTKVLEAMGHGKAVVGTIDSFTEIVCENGEDCLMIDPPKDTEQWVKVIVELLNDPNRILEIEKSVLKKMREFHDWKEHKASYVEEMRSL